MWREPDIQVKRQTGGRKAGQLARKRFVCNANATYEVKFHFVTNAEPNTEDLLIPESVAVFNHYRSQHPAYPNATMLDKQLFLEVPVLQNAIEKRFGKRYQDLVVELYENFKPSRAGHMWFPTEPNFVDEKGPKTGKSLRVCTCNMYCRYKMNELYIFYRYTMIYSQRIL